MGIQGIRGFGLLRDLGIEQSSRYAWPLGGQGQKGGLPAGRARGRQYRIARAGLLFASGRIGPQRPAPGIRVGRTGRSDAGVEIQNGFVRRPLRGPGARGGNCRLRSPPQAGAASRARDDHPAQEREQPRAAESAQDQIHRGHRAERGPGVAGRLQRHARSFVTVLEGIRQKVGDGVQVPITRRAARSPSAARGTRIWSRPAIRRRTAGKSRKRSRSPGRRM